MGRSGLVVQMKGRRRTRRFIKRCSWGQIRSDVRAKFSKGDYDIRAEWLGPSDYDTWVTIDKSRVRWLLKNRGRRMALWEIEWLLGWLRGDTTAIQRKYGVFIERCPVCGLGLTSRWSMHRLCSAIQKA